MRRRLGSSRNVLEKVVQLLGWLHCGSLGFSSPAMWQITRIALAPRIAQRATRTSSSPILRFLDPADLLVHRKAQ